MKSKAKASSKPQIVLKNGKPAAVILSIKEYEDMLEQLEQREDLRLLRAMRKKRLRFRRLEDVLEKTVSSQSALRA